MYVQRADSYQFGEKPSCALLKMRFPGPETTLGATIGPVTDEDFIRAKKTRPAAR
jgi:hypothetical protein